MNTRAERRSIWHVLGKLKKSELLEISKKYKTDYKCKKLPGHIFILCIIATQLFKESMSLRDFAFIFGQRTFQRLICNNTEPARISHSAFHYRFARISHKYFKECYEIIRNQFIHLFRRRKKKVLAPYN